MAGQLGTAETYHVFGERAIREGNREALAEPGVFGFSGRNETGTSRGFDLGVTGGVVRLS